MWSGLLLSIAEFQIFKISPENTQTSARPAYLKYVFAAQYLSSVQFNTYRSHCFFYIVEAVQGWLGCEE